MEVYRGLGGLRPDAFRPDLAMSLNNLAGRRWELGRREDEALAAIEEAVEVYRELTRRWPSAFQSAARPVVTKPRLRLGGHS